MEEWFAAKEFKTAMFYLRLKAYDSAILYLKAMVADYPRADVAPEALEKLVADGDTFAREQAVLMLEEAGHVDKRADELVQEGSVEGKAAKSFLKRIVATGATGRLRVLSLEHPVEEVRRELLALLPEEAA